MERITDKKQFVFIVGAPRSGTTWLQAILAIHPSVASLDFELRHFSGYIKPLVTSWRNELSNIEKGGWRQGLPLLWHEEKFHSFLKDFTDKVYLEVIRKNPSATHIVDKHPGYSLSIDEIKLIIPKAKIIHIIRDPREVVNSMISAKSRLGFGEGDIHRAINHWRTYVDACKCSEKKYSNDFLEIKYELLKSKSLEYLPKIFQFCGLSYSDELILSIDRKSDFSKMKVSKPDLKMNYFREKGVPLWEIQLSVKEKMIIHNELKEYLFENKYISKNDNAWYIRSMSERIKVIYYKLTGALKKNTR